MEHYKNLLSALGGAMPVCMVWLLAGTEEDYFNARDVFAFALSEGGEEEKLDEGQFYVVSEEGAIGLAVDYEYQTRWIFIPVENEEVLEREWARLREEITYDREHKDDESREEYADMPQEQVLTPPPMVSQARQNMPPQPQVPAPPPMMSQPQQNMQPQGQSIPPQGKSRFCMQCGFRLNANSKFCPKCGTPVQR